MKEGEPQMEEVPSKIEEYIEQTRKEIVDIEERIEKALDILHQLDLEMQHSISHSDEKGIEGVDKVTEEAMVILKNLRIEKEKSQNLLERLSALNDEFNNMASKMGTEESN
ncbi:MAG: hypothetical protein PHN19_03115 [Patescibacteria group bacterium]|nr:hypothetical protein [Patescibacteria group bacterium]